MRIQGTVAFVALSLAWSAPLVAAPISLPAQAGKDYKHKPTGVRLPPALAGLNRDSVRGFAGPETDVASDYRNADGSEDLTVFLFRNVSGNVPVWFDRARSYIMSTPEKYGRPTSLGTRPFTPRGQSSTTGLMEIFTTGGRSRSTGLMILPVNNFYAKIRFSSATLDAAQLEQQMLAAANVIDWSSRAVGTPASPIADCASPLPARGLARVAVVSEQDRMMSALVLGLFSQVPVKTKSQVQTFCREADAQQHHYGLYRPDASTSRYMLAIADSGRAVIVGSNDLAAVLSETKKSPRYSVSFVDFDETRNFSDFDGLPLPEQAMQHTRTTKPISVSGTWGKASKTVTIVTDK